jgi:hypothetical protein
MLYRVLMAKPSNVKAVVHEAAGLGGMQRHEQALTCGGAALEMRPQDGQARQWVAIEQQGVQGLAYS